MSNQTPSSTLEIWHGRLVHHSLDHKTLWYLSSKVSDISISEPKSILSKLCRICALERQHKQAETRTRERVTELLQVIDTNLCGPMQTPTRAGERYFIAFTDEKSGRVSISLLASKDGALAAFQTYRARAEKSSGKEIKMLRHDGGGEYLNKRF